MAALTRDRDTPIRGEVAHQLDYPQATATTIFAGAIVCPNASGFAAPGADTASFQRAVGRAAKQSVNAGANGAKRVIVESGVFKFANSGGTITDAHYGQTCTIVDDQTVGLAANTTNDIIAGTIVGVESDGVWVAMGPGEGHA